MKLSFSTAALASALTISVFLPASAHMGAMGGMGSASASAHASVGFGGHGFGGHGFGFHHFLRPLHPFHRPHVRFGGFGSHRSSIEFAGGFGGGYDYEYADENYGPYEDDDIDNLHFRAQEPFGPGDIGRPPVRAEADAPYMSDRMDPWHGYEPQDQ